MNVALELSGIVKKFGGVAAVDGVSLAVARGEVLALVGENGAGKSTLMNVLYGLYQPDAGEIRMDGKPVRITSPSDAIAARVSPGGSSFPSARTSPWSGR